MFGSKVKIPREMLDKIKDTVNQGVYSSVDEFVETALERELERISFSSSRSPDSEEIVRKQIQGLGYIE